MFVESYHPHSFRERGVSAPFTTPMLASARFRVAAGREAPALELVIPNPSGGRGAYVVAWPEHGPLCRTTLYDTFLGDALAARTDLPSLRPAMIRRLSWEVAALGYAGPDAAETACRALQNETWRHTQARGRLEAALKAKAPPGAERLIAVLGDLHALAPASAPVPRMIEAIGALKDDLTGWIARRNKGDELEAAARAVADAATTVHGGALRLLHAAVSLREQPEILLQRWIADPASLEIELTQADWLMDGWERLVLLWQDAGGGKAGRIREIADLLPCWPDEADIWLRLPAGTSAQAMHRPPRLAPAHEDAAQQLEQILRNERLREAAA